MKIYTLKLQTRPIMTIAAVVALLSLTNVSAVAQQRPMRSTKTVSGPTPHKADGKADFGGVWQSPRMADVTHSEGCCEASILDFTPWGKQRWESYDAAKADYAGSCLPFGLLRSVGGPHPIQIIQDDKYIAMLYEQNTWFHVTPIDGRPHPKDPDPTWFGNSVGHWEGNDTLVIDTIAFNGLTRVDTIGHPISDQLHTIERFQRPDLGHIAYTLTVDDPKTYTKPWVSKRTWYLRPQWEIMEYSCEENNKDLREGHIKPGVQP